MISAWGVGGTVQTGLIGASGLVSGFTRLYGEGGVLLAFPYYGVSSGQFGFEFFTGDESPVSYFLEVGSIGCGLRFDKLSNTLIFNGLRIQVGFRGYSFS